MDEILSDLINARRVAEGHPEFLRPSDEELAKLKPGDHVKVTRHDERFWVLVRSVAGDKIRGQVANDLVNPKNSDLKFKDPVCVEKDHVYDIQLRGGPVGYGPEFGNLRQVHHAESAYGRQRKNEKRTPVS